MLRASPRQQTWGNVHALRCHHAALQEALLSSRTGTPEDLDRAAPLQMKGGLEEEEEEEEEEKEEEEEEDLDDELDAARQRFMKDRRRARSLPALLLGNSVKRVKFADSMGLDLASVKTFSALEDPKVPSKVLTRYRSFPPPDQDQDLDRDRDLDRGDLRQGFRSSLDPHRLVALFPEPRDAERRVQRLRVCLERVSITQFDVRGHIRVLSGGAEKEVGLRYTFNDWLSYVDAQAVPAAAHQPGAVGERFSVTVHAPPGAHVHFAVYVRSEEGEFWDNCEGSNYTLRYRGLPGGALRATAAFHAT